MNSPRPHGALYVEKLTASFLAFLFIISPLGVFAQSSASTSSTPAAATSSGTSSSDSVPSTEEPSSTEVESSSQSSDPFQLGDGEPSATSEPPPNFLDSESGNG